MTRIEKIAAMAREKGVDAVLVTAGSTLQYATAFRVEGFVIVTAAGEGWCYTDSRYIEAATAAMTPLGYQVIQPEGSYPTFKTPQEVIDKCGIKTLGFEDLLMPVHDYNAYREALSVELVPIGNGFEVLRECKDELEVECIVAAQRIAESALHEIVKMIKPGAYEDELAAELEYLMRKKGSEGLAFSTIFLSGARTSMPHGKPLHKAIEPGDFVTIDFGARKNGYCSDMTRTFAVGFATDEMKKVYNTVLGAQLAAIEALEVGKPGCEVDGVARDYIAKAGYGDYFRHGLGHSLGLDVHENPRASMTYTGAFKQGNIITMEPGIYIPGFGGVRIEDMLYLGPEGKRDLTEFPKELMIL